MAGYVHWFAVLLFCGICSAVPAGREFATSFMQNMNDDSKNSRFMIEITALPTSQGPTRVTVTAVGKVYEKELQPSEGVSFQLPDSVEMRGSGRFLSTVLIKASRDVTVMSLNYKQDTADTSVVYPLEAWGTEYYIFTPSSYLQGTFKEFSITNHKNRNSVEVFLRGSVTFKGKYYRSGSRLPIRLEAYDSIQIQSQDDLSGTKVVSKFPVAVASGHSCAEMYTACNHVYEQLLPVNRWGKEFIVAPLPYHDMWGNHDSIFVQASQSTKVNINTEGRAQSFTMFAGQTIEVNSEWPYSTYLTCDKGIQVLFEFNGGPEYTTRYFDPFLMSILPTNLFSTSYSLEGQQDFNNAAIIVARNSDLQGLQLDKKPLPADLNWNKVVGSDYSWAELYYGTSAGVHQIAHPTVPFAVYSFGVAVANGYGSPASDNKAEKLDCSTIECKQDEECQMKESTPTCVKQPPAIKDSTCWAMGDPHYRTFDGHYYNFMGNCTYTMAKNCHADKSHPAFEVEAQNENHAGSKITFVGKVIIKIYGFSITIVRSEFGLVRMNYTLWNLPINLGNSKVKLSQSGLSVVMETDFGVTVQYDWEQHLVITVPGSFAGRMCGLCGNFNSKQEDDLLTPSGSLASNTAALGKSWRVPGRAEDAYCGDECTGQCESCQSDSFFEGFADKMFCGLLTHVMDGPFSSCHAIIEPKVYHENCLYDVCMGEGKWNFLCNTLQVYSDACQRAGVKIHNWRKIADCPDPACPENSHYEFCGSACPATCEDPGAPAKCNASCVETCACDKGFLLSGNMCVPKAQCGCMYKDHYYVKAGASFWGDEHCTENCTCNSDSKMVVCQKAGCKPGYECQVADDLIGCHPMAYAKCTVSGDPHYRTFDGYSYNFQGTCVYQMAGVCSKDQSLEHFDVFVQNDGRGKRAGSSAKLVEVKVYGYSIVISREHKGSVLINTELANLGVALNNSKIIVHRVGDFGEIITDFGLQVSYDWQSTVSVVVPSSYAGAVCGLCGNYNLNPKDDLELKGGKQAGSVEEMGKGWRVAEIPGCADSCEDKKHCPDCDITQKETFESNAYCGQIRDPKGAFHKCHGTVDTAGYFESCVYDVCLNNGHSGSWCNSLHSLTIACQRAGVNVTEWRRPDFCPVSEFQHPENSRYEHCASVCHVTCDSSSASSSCKKPCEEGWVCKEGFVLSGDECVSIDQCGCKYKGKYYKHGEVFHPDGLCKEECTCNGTVQCKAFSCGVHEKCEVNRGVRSCQPLGKGFCSVSGDPHYRTFDNVTYDFQGTCTYTAAEACRLQGTRLNAFSVVVENERWTNMDTGSPHGDPKVSVAKLVAVEVHGNTLILRKNQIGMIMLNAAMTSVPLNINKGQIQVYQEGTHYAITTDFGLKVTYDLVYHVTVTVPGNYRGRTCGLCGNFNDDKTDEFHLPGGEVAKDPRSFGAAWKVGVPGVVCEDGCDGDLCPKCASHQKASFERHCKIITDATGPFAACHKKLDPASYYRDCVYDVCLSEGDRKVLCHSVAAYMTDCQSVGVKINSWRTPDFCPLNCPTNSHYQICAEVCFNPCPGLTDTITCPTSCAEGCTCDEGYYFNGTGCVQLDKCSCFHNGRTYRIGESVYSQGCQEVCTCAASGSPQCADTQCGMAEMCTVKNNTRGCYPKQCLVEGGGSITLFSGRMGMVPAMGAYEIITHCRQSENPEWFRVVAKLQECSFTGRKSVVAVYIYFNDTTVTVTDKQEAWVNGRKVTLPYQTRNVISVKVFDKTIVVEKMSSLRLSYSHFQDVTVSVSDSIADNVCGACGTLLSARDMYHLQDTMQEYMAAFVAQDFPTCGL